MSAKVTYDSKYIRPVETVNFDLNIERNGACEVIDSNYTISLQGYILAQKGSPQRDGTFGDFDGTVCETVPYSGWSNAIMRKYCHLQNLFSHDFKELCWGSDGYVDNMTAYPKLINMSLSTDDGNPQYAKYTAEFEADNIFCGTAGLKPSGIDCIKTYDDEWEFSYSREFVTSETGDNRVFEVSRTISAEGAPKIVNGTITKSAAECAKDFVCANMTHGTDYIPPTGCILPDQYMQANAKKRNYTDVHTVNIAAGTYSVTESWVYTSGNYVDNYTVNFNDSDQDGCSTVSIAGTITGYDCRVSGVVTESAFGNASARLSNLIAASGFHARAESVTSLTLDTQSESSTIGYNPFGGTVDYDYTYKERPSKLIANAKFEQIDVSNNWEEDIIYKFNILEKGEVVGTVNGGTNGAFKAPTTNLNINLVYPCDQITHVYGPRFDATEAAAIQNVVDMYHPSGLQLFNNIAVESQNEDWDRNSGTYSYSVTWTYNYSGIVC